MSKSTDINTLAEEAGDSNEVEVKPQARTRAPAKSQILRNELFAREAALYDADDRLDDHWSIPWSDLMMVMFVLFAALLVAKMMQPDIEVRYKTRPIPEIREIEKERVVDKEILSQQPSFEPLMRINVFDRSQEAIRETQLQNVDIALLDDQSVKVSVQGPMFFERGKVDLLPKVAEFLDRLAIVIQQTPYQIHIIGHTDDNPIRTAVFPSNWELSVVRASRVARYLIRSGSIDPARFIVMGRGQFDPAYPNEDEEFRALNRRVEIIITRDVASDT